METIVKRPREFTPELNVLLSQLLMVDDPSYNIDEEFKVISVQQLLNFILSRIDLRELEIYISKPILSLVTQLPVEDIQLGDRYFIISGDLFLKIAEWNGASWNIVDTKNGDSFYSFSQKKFIVRTIDNYVLSSERDSFEIPFTSTENVVVNHNLNKYPSIVVMDSSNRAIITQVTYRDRNICEVSWSGETSGTIVCN
ncbi:MAG: hypothetical protein WCO13_15050 [Bacteroidota bacterium]